MNRNSQKTQLDALQRDTGFVIIGRNEGDRLKRCLESVVCRSTRAVYVDSGSVDGSVEYARSVGVKVVCLDGSTPFSAARARNAGFEALESSWQSVEYVQFVDGDCELVDGWIEAARKFLVTHPVHAVVAGRRLERQPEASVYNTLCHIEWNTPVGDATATGGDFLVRSQAFSDVGGFNPEVVAGEEPDLCYRLAKNGWKIRRIDKEMTIHDARMTRFSQWWKRASRAGHAYIHGFVLHRTDHDGYYRKQAANIWVWALGVPVFVLCLATIFGPVALTLLLVYPVQALRIAVRERRRSGGSRNALLYGAFTVLAKWPQLVGQLRFLKRRLFRARITIIEHR